MAGGVLAVFMERGLKAAAMSECAGAMEKTGAWPHPAFLRPEGRAPIPAGLPNGCHRKTSDTFTSAYGQMIYALFKRHSGRAPVRVKWSFRVRSHGKRVHQRPRSPVRRFASYLFSVTWELF